ncbi:LamG-like jellyroll fold domain-containing protein [Flavivirga spongiicola]|uniref:LamG domain-containing protein n=1 Tax=Flavivirga spongiicola TaxID=421621 RepID=A0ABU7XXJ8_9FLAO|nr:LamG-like jellyroll fold domain-containing protein [Flavivirga sp. MEBiC05379]MDO5980263.1 LamG-like jellyroll fold domain-containing protein [Flavivirga sp. MEBiC05379]
MKKLCIVLVLAAVIGCAESKKKNSTEQPKQQTESNASISGTNESANEKIDVAAMDHIVTYWDFGKENPFVSKGAVNYTLQKANDSVSITEMRGIKCLNLEEGGYLYIPREACPALNFHSENSSFTIVAKVNRLKKSYEQCEAIAGMWNETQKKRQYYLFLNLLQKESGDQVCGHVSDVGGPTPGHRWARDASIGKTPIAYGDWVTIAFTFDGAYAKSYLNGKLDSREGLNPYEFKRPLFDGGEAGSDFTVGAVDRLGEMGNYFVGGISYLAVFNKALSEAELKAFN